VRLGQPSGAPARPFLKWAGGKSRALPDIRLRYPPGLGETITKYAEPFAGGGAVLFDVLGRYRMKEVYVSDINRELVQTYIAVRDDPAGLIGALKGLEARYLGAGERERRDIYYASRERFNALKPADGEPAELAELAALFVFLNRTCFNGLYRVNSRGAFNVPQGRYANPAICDERGLLAASEALRGAEIVCASYAESRRFIDGRTFAYFDPPYRPLTATASFTSYAVGGFGDKEQAELAAFIDEMGERGAFVLASNSDPKSAGGGDDFLDRLYSRHAISRIGAGRAINSVGASRGKVSELLICGARSPDGR
jgi:DNA adenine methylase